MQKVSLRAVFVVLMALPAMADPVIFDNGTPDGYGAGPSDADIPYQMAEDFVLAEGNNIITGINWWGAYSYAQTLSDDDFTIYLYADNGGEPDISAFLEIAAGNANRTATAQAIEGNDNQLFAYSVAIAPLTLTAGQTYYLSIVNDTTADWDDTWYWATSAIGVGDLVPGRFGVDDGSEWGTVSEIPVELAFQLTGPASGVVPEPASMALLGIGLTGFAVRRFRKH